MSTIEIGKVCVVKERTKLKDRGSYVGVIISINNEDDTVYVMNEDGIYITRVHCIMTNTESIKTYYEELKKEHSRIHKLAEKLCNEIRDLYETIHKTTDNWTNFIKGIVFEERKPMSKSKVENIMSLIELRNKKMNKVEKYWDYYWYMDKLMQDIRKNVR